MLANSRHVGHTLQLVVDDQLGNELDKTKHVDSLSEGGYDERIPTSVGSNGVSYFLVNRMRRSAWERTYWYITNSSVHIQILVWEEGAAHKSKRSTRQVPERQSMTQCGRRVDHIPVSSFRPRSIPFCLSLSALFDVNNDKGTNPRRQCGTQ